MAYYCADCAYRAPGIKSNGKFACTNRRSGYSEVPATQPASYCSVFCNAMGSTYSTKEKEDAYNASKRHGWFIVTAITQLLNLPEDNDYMNCFGYIRECYIPESGYQMDFLDDYERTGSSLAEKMINDPNGVEYAKYLIDTYLNDFVSLVQNDEVESAIDIYVDMYDAVKNNYGFEINRKKDSVKRLVLKKGE